MAAWSEDELHRISKADDLHVSPFREDGVTYGTPTWVWCVVIDDAVFARAYNGAASCWYQAALRQRAGRVTVDGMTKEVTFNRSTDLFKTGSTTRTDPNTTAARIWHR